MTPPSQHDRRTRSSKIGPSGTPGAETWSERCARLFEEMRRPARAMVARAYGRALADEEIEDVYSAAWAATLAALRDRGQHMEEGELRAYILTAVASHASKEMRRRSRKPSQPLEADREQSAADDHALSPEELAIGSEARGVARDLLSSLPERRRAVMLLRYGWGLSPNEVCALVPGLSPRAYRKEIGRGVEELIEGLRKVETGAWCADREHLVRDLVAGTADEAARRQAMEHLRHCRACSSLAAQLTQELHAVGAAIALSGVAGSIGASGFGLLRGLGEVAGTARSAIANAVEKAQSTIGAMAASGGTKGAGAGGAGAAAKLAGTGTAVKAVVACAGVGAAATACVAAGIVPGVGLPGIDTPDQRRTATARKEHRQAESPKPRAAIASLFEVSQAVRSDDQAPPHQADPTPSASQPPAPQPAPVPVEQPPPAPSPVEEFDPVASTASTSSPSATGGSESSAGTGPSATAAAQDEFGP
jgi:RNA polymerase sigma factor (sigma-70 family)